MLLVFLATVCQEKDLRWESVCVSAGCLLLLRGCREVCPLWSRQVCWRSHLGTGQRQCRLLFVGTAAACAWGGRCKREMHGAFTVHSLWRAWPLGDPLQSQGAEVSPSPAGPTWPNRHSHQGINWGCHFGRFGGMCSKICSLDQCKKINI